MNIEVSNVSDSLIGVLANQIFQSDRLKSPVDEALRAALLKEIRRRGSASGSNPPEPFFVALPELRLAELLAAAFGLVDKIIRINRAAVSAHVAGDLTSYEDLIDGTRFLNDVAFGLVQMANQQLTREKERLN
jgi:hypothetical protein